MPQAQALRPSSIGILEFQNQFQEHMNYFNTEKFCNLLRKEKECRSFSSKKSKTLYVRKQFMLLISELHKRRFLSLLLCFPSLTEDALLQCEMLVIYGLTYSISE